MNKKLPFRIKKYNANKFYGTDTFMYIVLALSVCLSILFLMFAIFGSPFSEDILTGPDLLLLSLLFGLGPIGFYNNIKANKKRMIEDQLPDFLREISSATSSGMTVFDAIKTSAKGDHGKLTSELKLMSAQLSWGVSVNEALENFAKRINTPSVKRIVVTINKALEIGGNTADVFEAAAKEIDQTKLVETQRKVEMSMYAIVIFISFFVFLAVILIINGTIFAEFFRLQPQLQAQSNSGLGGPNIAKDLDPEGLKNAFYAFVVVQSVGGGLLGGFMMDGRLSSGVRFGFILVLVSFFTFKFLF